MQKSNQVSEFTLFPVPTEMLEEVELDLSRTVQYSVSRGRLVIEPITGTSTKKRDDFNRMIADAKYKPIDNIGNRDYLQVLAYMFRFDAKLGLYLYPEATGEEDLVLHLNSGISFEKNVFSRDDICVVKHGLRIPTDAVSYEAFVEKMLLSEAEFCQSFGTYLNDCKVNTPHQV